MQKKRANNSQFGIFNGPQSHDMATATASVLGAEAAAVRKGLSAKRLQGCNGNHLNSATCTGFMPTTVVY